MTFVTFDTYTFKNLVCNICQRLQISSRLKGVGKKMELYLKFLSIFIITQIMITYQWICSPRGDHWMVYLAFN